MKKIGEVYEDTETGKTFIAKENPDTIASLKSELIDLRKTINQLITDMDKLKNVDASIRQKLIDAISEDIATASDGINEIFTEPLDVLSDEEADKVSKTLGWDK